MKLTYKDKSLERLCTDQREMQRKRGDIAQKLRLRIFALEAAETLGDLTEIDPSGKWHPLTGNRAGQWSGRVSRNERLIIIPQQQGGLKVESILAVTEAKVWDIEDYHGR